MDALGVARAGERRQLRRGAKVVRPSRLAGGQTAEVRLRLTALQRRILRDHSLRASFRLRVKPVEGTPQTRVVRIATRVR